MIMVSDMRDRLEELHKLTAQTPLFNPVFQLSLEISREIEGEKSSLKDISVLVADLECEGLLSRARHLHDLLQPVTLDENLASFRILVDASAIDFESFAARWARPLLHTVFTAHPTFLLTPAQSEAVAVAASSGSVSEATVCTMDAPRQPITLDSEHAEAMAAMQHAAVARDELVGVIFDVAAAHWPDRWQKIRPLPFRLATWVGYDMDGRTDIGWETSIRYRLEEKARRLAGYIKTLADVDPENPARALLTATLNHTNEMQVIFSTDLSAPTDVSTAANHLTAEHSARLVSLDGIMTALDSAAAQAETAKAIELLKLVAAMRADGLGMGWIHFRVNSAQLHNAIRQRIDPENTLDLDSRTALHRIRTLIDDVKPLRTNFAALAIENTTAIRQFLAMAQIIHHIDADAPIRMLIAECESPFTVLAALYFAKLFGIADKVDVSPLFETESALEHGARFLDDLLAEPAYQSYVRARGRVAIQTGFSDAGRFVGQLPAALAIERLQSRLARLMAKYKLQDIAALIFNTHGESMGRGAHPSSMDDRLHYPLSVWARQQFATQNINLESEISFQGGDGYLFFRTPQLALATLVRIAEIQTQPLTDEKDPFYVRTDVTLDFYRGIRRVQRDYLASRIYARAITAFGLGLLNETGSRKSRRQSDLAADREMNLRQIRAIPHNAVLQQLGYPVNVIAGVGTAAEEDLEGVAEIFKASPRGQILLRMLLAANRLASIKTVAAYGELFNSAYWASRPYRGTEQFLDSACLALADRLTDDDRAGVFRVLASRLRVDGVKLHRLLDLLPVSDVDSQRENLRRSLGVLHALRLALMQHMFLRAVQIPAFSRSNDISRDDILEMIFTLRIEEAVTLLRRAFPVSAPSLADFAVTETSDYPDGDTQAYASIQSAYIDPIAQAWHLCLRIGAAIANHFGAHG
jgi:phosphoenolpyruvate carboxylase